MDILIDKAAGSLTALICKNTEVKENDEEKIKYALLAIMNEVVKIIILTSIFLCIGKLKYFVFSMVILLTLRSFSGGKHFNTSLKCLVISLVYFIITCILFIDYITIPVSINYIFILISLILMGVFSPCPNPKRPIRHEKRRWRLKIISILLSLLIASILLFTKDEKLLCCGTMSMFLQAVQLIHKGREVL